MTNEQAMSQVEFLYEQMLERHLQLWTDARRRPVTATALANALRDLHADVFEMVAYLATQMGTPVDIEWMDKRWTQMMRQRGVEWVDTDRLLNE